MASAVESHYTHFMNQTVRTGPFEYVVDASRIKAPLSKYRYNYVGKVVRLVRLPEDRGMLPVFVDLGLFQEHPAETANEAVRKVMAEVGQWIRREQFRARQPRKGSLRTAKRIRRRNPDEAIDQV